MHIADILEQEPGVLGAAERLSLDPLAAFPILIAKIKLTWRCNLRCQMCELWQRCQVADHTLPAERVKSALTALKLQGLRKVHFSGGEVMLYSEFEEVVSHARSLDLQVNLTSNGTLIDKEMARFLVNQRVHTVTVSIDSPNPEKHDQIRGISGAWHDTMEALGQLQKRKARKGRGPRLAVNTLITRSSVDKLPALYELLNRKGIDSWRLLPIDTIDKFERPTASQWRALAAQWRAWKRLLARVPIDCSSERSAERAAKGKYAGTYYPENRCFAPWFNVFVDADGKVYPCCMGKIEMMPYGNLLEQEMEELLKSNGRHQLRCSFGAGHMYPICENCDDFLEENQAFNGLTDNRT